MATDDPMPMIKIGYRSKTAIFFMAVIAISLAVTTPTHRAWTYILEGPHILELTAEAMGRITAIRMTQKRLVYGEAPDAPPTQYDETAIYIMPERFRSDIVSDRIQRTYLVFADSSLLVTDGRITEGKSPLDVYQQLLRSRSRWRLMRTVNLLGVETAISSLGRVADNPVFIIGAHYPDESVCQLAIDKETFLPIRLLLVDPNAGAMQKRLEMLFLDWKKVQEGMFPYKIMFTVDDHLTQTIEVTNVETNPPIPEDLMDPEALRASVAAQSVGSAGQKKEETVNEIQKAVHDFQKKFE